MAKTQLEKAIEKQMKQAKQLADKQYRNEQKLAREEKRMERKVVLRDRATTIIGGQPIIEGFRIMDKTAEEVLQCLLKCKCDGEERIHFEDSIFPEYLQMSIDLELEKLVQYGMIGGLIAYDNGGFVY